MSNFLGAVYNVKYLLISVSDLCRVISEKIEEKRIEMRRYIRKIDDLEARLI